MRSTLFLSLVPGIHAWGQLGHATVAYIAQDLIAQETVSWVQKILGNSNSSYMADIASWADDYRYTSEGSWSEPFHFIDANDSPPSSCSVEFSRDCGSGGCLVSAMQNYTQRVQDTSLDSEQLMEALEFIIHFTGDSTQPLHCENLDVGGNDIDVTFGGTSTNLHHIWDTNMLEKLRGSFTLSVASSWAQDLVTEIKTGNYSSEAGSWLDGMSLSDPQSTVMAWVTDANTFDCSYVLKQSISYLESNDLSGSYYDGAVPIFSQQIAKGGYRLAAWLNLLATGSTQLGGGGGSGGTSSAAPSTPASSAPPPPATSGSGGYSEPTGGYGGSSPTQGHVSSGGYSQTGGYTEPSASSNGGWSQGGYSQTGGYAEPSGSSDGSYSHGYSHEY